MDLVCVAGPSWVFSFCTDDVYSIPMTLFLSISIALPTYDQLVTGNAQLRRFGRN